MLELIFTISRIPIAKFREFRGLASINIQTQIPKFSFFEIC